MMSQPINTVPATVVTVDSYRQLGDLPSQRDAKRRRFIGAFAVVALFAAAAVAYYMFDGGKAPVDSNAAEARKALDAELQQLHAPLNIVLLAAGLTLLLAGKRLYTVAFFVAGFIAGGFLAFTVWTSGAATLTCISAQAKMYIAAALSLVCGGVLGASLARLERFGTAVVGGCAGYAGGYLLYPITLDHYVSVWWGQYALGAILALLAFALVFAWERELLVTTSCAAGAFASAVGGAQLFFNYSPTSADFQQHWKDASAGNLDAGTDAQFWEFLGAVVALFVLGMLVQLKLDPCLFQKNKHEGLSFYDDEEQQRQQQGSEPAVVTNTGVRLI